ncbi:hypothetical protein FB45DRAFT_940093 [Roridomyces roridus]|uniref:F-box domain-containing protein n=1 Tax=Roridomyces roridus TaxID=1738132 RepID=A0AAD7B7A1_9AGAR|nr:hypothetical protein FB45DRAFT_940093 [Roridomyces roridus]
MVSTRRAQKARMLITRWLPNEVLTHIIGYLYRPDQATVARISRLFHGLTLPLLNRTIVLDMVDRPDIIWELCLTFTDHPERADAVRSLTIMNSSWGESNLDFSQLFETINLMKQLEYLHFEDGRSHDALISRLSVLSLPDLSTLHMIFPQSDLRNTAVSEFLSRHPTLTHVHLWDIDDSESDPTPPDRELLGTPNLLPNLQLYQGTTQFLDAFCTRSLEAARICVHQGNIHKVLALEELRDPALPFALSLDIRVKDDEMREVLEFLAEHATYITSLQIRILGRRFPDEITACIDSITQFLPQFPNLGNLELNHDFYNSPLLAVSEEAWQTWIGIAPTLRACCVGKRAWQKVDQLESQWVEYTRNKFEAQAGFSSFLLVYQYC